MEFPKQDQYLSTPTYSFQNVLMVDTNKIFNVKVFLPSPFIMLTSNHKNEIKVYIAADTTLPIFNDGNIGVSFWSLSNELFREPDNGFFGSNIVKIRFYKEDNGSVSNI